jgi:hypothetical protein
MVFRYSRDTYRTKYQRCEPFCGLPLHARNHVLVDERQFGPRTAVVAQYRALDLVDLLREYAVGLIGPAGQVFERSDPPIAE